MKQIVDDMTVQKGMSIPELVDEYATLTKEHERVEELKGLIKAYAEEHPEVFAGGTIWDLENDKLRLTRSERVNVKFNMEKMTLGILEEILRSKSFACLKVSFNPKEVKSETDDPDIHRILKKIEYKTEVKPFFSLGRK